MLKMKRTNDGILQKTRLECLTQGMYRAPTSHVTRGKNPGELQVHWKSAIPERWKRNTILGALHRAKRIATIWKEEVKGIKLSFLKSRYPAKFVNEVIHDFENPRDEETIIPVHWFDERTKIGIPLPSCSKNEVESKKFIKKLNIYQMEFQPLYHLANAQDRINI